MEYLSEIALQAQVETAQPPTVQTKHQFLSMVSHSYPSNMFMVYIDCFEDKPRFIKNLTIVCGLIVIIHNTFLKPDKNAFNEHFAFFVLQTLNDA